MTLLRGAIRGVLRACSPELAALVRAALERDDNYAAAGKPVCDWDDLQTREQLVDGLFALERAAAYAALWAGVPTGLELASAPVAACATRELLVEGTSDSTADGIADDKSDDAPASRPAIQEGR